MCGRYVVDVTKEELSQRFHATVELIKLTSSYNVTPGSYIPAVIQQSPNTVVLMKWGLIPHWSKEFRVKYSTINARAENLSTSPVYRLPYQKQRCLIPANGFYEWQVIDKNIKQPYFIFLKNRSLFSFAGIFDTWKDAEDKVFWTCSLITTAPNDIVRHIHSRMPVILKIDDEQTWLSLNTQQNILNKLLAPYSSTDTEAYPVGLRVNNPKNDDKSLVVRDSGVH